MAEVKYKYPYVGWSDSYKYGNDWSNSQVTLNRNYTYPLVFNNATPKLSRIVIDVEVWTNYPSIYNYSWNVYVYANGWYSIHTFTPPTYETVDDSDGKYHIEVKLDITLSTPRNVTQIAVVPASRVGSGTSWSNWYAVREMEFTETISDLALSESDYFCGLYLKKYSLNKSPGKVQVNIDGVMTTAKQIAINVGGSLEYLKKVDAANFVAKAKEDNALITFTPDISGKYIFDAYGTESTKTDNGYVYFKVFDNNMNELMTSWDYNEELELTAGTTYKIIAIDCPYYTGTSDRLIKVYIT